MKEKEKDILGDTQYKEQQLKNFYDTFMGGAHGIQPSHSKEEGASLPGIERYEKPDMTESQREFLKEFQEYCRIIDFGGNASVIPDISKCRVPYRDELNEDQLRAVTWSKGPLLVIAGAGTGKTRTICYRTAYLIEQGVSPGEILLLTFTRKAAQEMTDRTSMLIQDAKAAGKVHGGTFHGFANYILRRYADMIGLDRNYTILDNVDAQDVISLIRDEMKLTRKKQSPVPKSSVIITVLSRARSCERSISEVILREYEYLEPYQGDIELIGRVFREFKQAHRQMDYDDLLEVLHDMLKQNSLFRKKIQQKYRFIIVDEFQDTNLVQGRLVKLLAGEDPQVMVVGDDAQSIYSFRGSRHENILRFPKVFPSCGIVKIQQNYRSRKGILTYTNSVIDSMEFGYKKALVTSDAGEGKPEVRRFFYQQDEAGWICGRIEELREQGIPLEQIAVLFRSQYLSDYLQAELLKRRIPFTVYGGLKFVERRHVKDMLAYLRIALNTLDAAAWNRILRLLPDIGSVRASMVIQTVMQNGGYSMLPHSGVIPFHHAWVNWRKFLKCFGMTGNPFMTGSWSLSGITFP